MQWPFPSKFPSIFFIRPSSYHSTLLSLVSDDTVEGLTKTTLFCHILETFTLNITIFYSNDRILGRSFIYRNHSSKRFAFVIKRPFIPLYTAEYQFLSYATGFWEWLHNWKRMNVASSKHQCTIYREILAFVDRFTALHFTANGAPSAARRIIILSMNQYAWWPIQFEIKGSGLCGPLDDVMFYGEQCGSCVGICLWFVSSGRQFSVPIAVWFKLQLLSSVFRHCAVYFRATCIPVWHQCEMRIY
jgi:hypothetical protein